MFGVYGWSSFDRVMAVRRAYLRVLGTISGKMLYTSEGEQRTQTCGTPRE